MDAVATAGAQPAQLLDVQVDQLTRVGALIAAEHRTGWAVHERQPVEAMADQHPVDGGGWPAHPRGDLGRAKLEGLAQLADLGLDRSWDAVGMGMGTARPIDQASWTKLTVASPPAIGAGAGDAHLRGDMGSRPASRDPLAHDEPSRRGQAGGSVGHRDLRVVRMPWTAPYLRSEVPTVNNPRAQYT